MGGARFAEVIAAGALLLLAAGCGGESQVDDGKPGATARVGPECAELRRSDDPEHDAYVALLDFVYKNVEGRKGATAP